LPPLQYGSTLIWFISQFRKVVEKEERNEVSLKICKTDFVLRRFLLGKSLTRYCGIVIVSAAATGAVT